MRRVVNAPSRECAGRRQRRGYLESCSSDNVARRWCWGPRLRREVPARVRGPSPPQPVVPHVRGSARQQGSSSLGACQRFTTPQSDDGALRRRCCPPLLTLTRGAAKPRPATRVTAERAKSGGQSRGETTASAAPVSAFELATGSAICCKCTPLGASRCGRRAGVAARGETRRRTNERRP